LLAAGIIDDQKSSSTTIAATLPKAACGCSSS
jgi:hypothetical protein